jgi:hypothetical protein
MDYADKIADINQSTSEAQQEARADAQKKEQEAESDHQDKLKELREKYLMDLEEALHDRDARQILRLMRQYQIDKNQAVKDREQKKQDSQIELQQKLQDIEVEKQKKLEAAAQELEDKREQIARDARRARQDAAIAANRALADARIAHNRALAEQQQYLQRKLRDLAEALAAEYNMSSTQAQALIRMWTSTYGTLSGLSSVNNKQPLSSSVFTSSTPVVSSTWQNSGLFGTGGLAEGGSFLATTPTSINVAENRPEMITATPLGRPGRDINKLFTNMGGGEGGGSSVEIGLSLSPDLEHRIIRKSMDETARVIVRTNKSKV